MLNVTREDKFTIPSLTELPSGYYILQNSSHAKLNTRGLLENIIVTDEIDYISEEIPVFYHPEASSFFTSGDIAFISSKGVLRVVLSKLANHNTLLVTERCDNRCLFCSQPPKDRDDSWLLKQAAMAALEFDSKDCLGISGGEPLLYGDSFLNFLDVLIENKNEKPLHVLTNGRKLANTEFAKALAERSKSLNITYGIPLYSSIASIHNLLVGSLGAFNDTLKGLVNAGNLGLNIELRIIPTKDNIDTLAQTVELVSRCKSNVSQFSIMNLEPTGWAKHNWEALYVNPKMYLSTLEEAVDAAHRANIPAYLFNYPICHISDRLEPLALKSISDWKNYYPGECQLCIKKDQCTGFFTSSKGTFHQNPRRIV